MICLVLAAKKTETKTTTKAGQPTRQSDVFFIYKYNTKTKKWVSETCACLKRNKILCGSHEIIGLPKLQNIVQSIRLSKAIAVLITPDFNEGEWNKYKLYLALNFKIPLKNSKIIPLYLNSTENDIPHSIRHYHGLDVSGDRNEWWHKLVKALEDWWIFVRKFSITTINTESSFLFT